MFVPRETHKSARMCANICNMWKLSALEGQLWSASSTIAYVSVYSRSFAVTYEAGCVLWAHNTILVAPRHDLRRLPSLFSDKR